MTNMSAKQIDCPKCEGIGRIREYAFIDDGICWKCGGTGKVNAPKARNPSRRDIERAAAKEARIAAETAEYERVMKIAFSDPRVPHSPIINVTPDNQWYKTQLIEAYRYHQKWGWGDLTEKYSETVNWWAA